MQGDGATLNSNPLFVRSPGTGDDYGDLRLRSNPPSDVSPCIDAGDNALVPFDTTDLDGDGDTAEQIPLDLDGNPRTRCVGGQTKVDMGAYETKSRDCNRDGTEDGCQGIVWLAFDVDWDSDVDQSDFAWLQACLTGAGSLATQACRCANANLDDDVDSDDLDLFEQCASGPGITPTADCAPPQLPPPPAPPPDPCDTPGNYFTITAWRSVRTHGAVGALGIALDPDAALNEAVIEPRQDNTQRIEVDLTQPAYPWTDVSFIQVTGSDASQPVPSGYAFLNNDQTLRISFNAADPNNRLNDQVCYTIDLSNAIVDAGITTMVMCDADCAIRMLAADADENVAVEQADANAIIAADGQTAGSSNVRLDVNVDGVINGTDESIATGLIGNTVTCGGGMMSVGGEGVEITARPMKKLLGARAPLAPESLLGPSGRGFPSSLPPNAERIPRREGARKGFRAEQMRFRAKQASHRSLAAASAPDLLTLLREAMASGLPLEQILAGPRTLANVSASLVLHDTGATSVILPATGGTISVDLVVTTDTPIWGFETRLAVDAANVVSIDSADWTELDNVLFSHDVDGHNQSSHYDLTVMDWLWVRFTPDGTDATEWGMDVDSLLGADPPTTWTLTNSLAAVDGPIAAPAGNLFTTTASIGGATQQLLPVGQTAVATLSLTISGTPGTYHLTLSDGSFINEAMASVPMIGGPELEIIVGQ